MSKVYQDVCPCKDCNEREVGCHAICIAYKDWQKNGIEIKRNQFFDFRKKKRRR